MVYIVQRRAISCEEAFVILVVAEGGGRRSQLLAREGSLEKEGKEKVNVTLGWRCLTNKFKITV